MLNGPDPLVSGVTGPFVNLPRNHWAPPVDYTLVPAHVSLAVWRVLGLLCTWTLVDAAVLARCSQTLLFLVLHWVLTVSHDVHVMSSTSPLVLPSCTSGDVTVLCCGLCLRSEPLHVVFSVFELRSRLTDGKPRSFGNRNKSICMKRN